MLKEDEGLMTVVLARHESQGPIKTRPCSVGYLGWSMQLRPSKMLPV